MADNFVAEIRIFGGNFAPEGWAFCDGQVLAISQNTALFSLLGTNYGGDGISNFALPNLQGAAPLSQGQGAGLTNRIVGETGGEAQVTLTDPELPTHSHAVRGTSATASVETPISASWGTLGRGRPAAYAQSSASNVTMNTQTTAAAGSGGAHNNLPPYLCLTFIIALQGIFPARN